MSISSLKVTTDVDGEYTLPEIMELLGSPKKLKDALGDLEKTAKDANKALKALKAATVERDGIMAQSAKERASEIAAIQKDKIALEAAWKRLDDDTAVKNANHQDGVKVVREAERLLKLGQAQLKADQKTLADARVSMLRQGASTEEDMELLRIANTDLRKSSADMKIAADQRVADVEERMAEMRRVLG